MSNNSNRGWQVRRVRDLICHVASGPSPTCEERNIRNQEWGLLKTTAITWDGWDPSAHKVLPREYWGNQALEVRSGDVVVTKAGPRHRVGVVAYVDKTPERLSVSGKMVLLRPNVKHVLPSILAGLLSMPSPQKFLDERTSGMAESQVNFSNSALLEASLEVPPLEEQRRIAEILDALDLLLVKQEKVASKLESLYLGLIESLVGHLFAEAISPLGDIFVVKAGITLGPDRAPALRPRSYLRVANVHRRSIDLSDLAQMECSATEESVYSLAKGDLLVVEGHANPEEIGRCAMVGHDAVGHLYQNHLFRLRSGSMVPKFAEIWLNSSFVRSYWRRMCATSSGLYTINSRMLRNLRVPNIRIEDQSRIIQPIVALEERIGCERSYAERLRLLKQGLAEDLLTGRVQVPDAEAVVESL